ncbi:hypothetical protein [Nocardia sp. NPDC058633]|uniref:hypothetical protein n=1 Tax=Nocardia sp. NPDC058633 TaxID=3346568 RepID=UPI00364CA908
MTLIVAGIHGKRISVVGDTKISFAAMREGGRRRSMRVYDGPVLKLSIVRSDLAIGVAGDDPVHALRETAFSWDKPIEVMVDALCQYSEESRRRSETNLGAAFLVCALNPLSIWRIENGVAYNRSSRPDLAWVGDNEPFEMFEDLYNEWPNHFSVEFRLLSSMQGIVTGPFASAKSSVGGHAVHVTTVDGRFQYLGNQEAVFAPTPGNGHFFHQRLAIGASSTPGALGCFIEGRRRQALFRHQKPWEPIWIDGETVEQMINAAASEFDQYLKAADSFLPTGNE